MKTKLLKELIASLGLKYKSEFVPFSQSRNAKPNPKPGDYSLNWKITISKAGHTLSTDYMQSIGHIPGYKRSRYGITTETAAQIRKTCEVGSQIPPPALVDVLYSLITDSDALMYDTFEDWAETYGYNPDSRKAENIYHTCLETGLKLRNILGNTTLEKLQEAYQDY